MIRHFIKHFYEIFWGDILMSKLDETFCGNILMRHFDQTWKMVGSWDPGFLFYIHFEETFWWNILMRHFDETFWWHMLMSHLMKHFDQTFWGDILMTHFDKNHINGLLRVVITCNDFWWPLMTSDMVIMLMGWTCDSFDCLLYD